MSVFPLRVLVGRAAWTTLHARGLRLDDVDVLVGAAGGTKFLLLGGLDRALFGALRATRRRVLHCVGASIGSWRLACLASRDPAAALTRLADAYIEEKRYAPDARTFHCEVARGLLDAALEGNRDDAIAEHPVFRLHVLASRCLGLAASDRRWALGAAFGAAAALNVVSRQTLAWQLERAIFHAGGDLGPLGDLADLPTRHAILSAENLRAALLASAAVPLLVRGVRVPNVDGVYRDGGIVDYHPVLDLPPGDVTGARPSVESPDDVTGGGATGLVLYPHFYAHLTPGWFDRPLRFRRARAAKAALDRTVLIAPTERFVRERLPGGIRPSRADARRHTRDERARRWRAVWRAGDELGDALHELLASPAKLRAHLVPLP